MQPFSPNWTNGGPGRRPRPGKATLSPRRRGAPRRCCCMGARRSGQMRYFQRVRPQRWRCSRSARESEDRPSMFNKAERSTVTSGDAPSELDRVAHPLDELANTLACSSSPQWEAARCRHTAGSTTALFFSDDIGDINEAKRICSGCPMAVPCVEGALDRHEPCGVWGGYLFANGQILAHKRPRGRPPKNQPTPSTTQLVVGRRAHERSRSV